MPDSKTQSTPESGSAHARPPRIHRMQIYGLILLALLLVLLAFIRADKHALFAPGWWRIG